VSPLRFILGIMDTSPSWVPDEDDLPPGIVSPFQVAATYVARAFDAFARGDWELCGELLADGQHATGDVFTAMVERVVSPAYPYRVDSPHWAPFLEHLAFMVLEPAPAGDSVPHADPIDLAAELRAMGLM
jgi:hypothetical protein